MSKKAAYLEEIHQAAAIRALRMAERAGYALTSAGDQNAEQRGAKAMAKAVLTGLTPGETDLRVYIGGGVLLSIELKTEVGRVSQEQKDRHARLRELGFKVSIVRSDHPRITARTVMDLVADELGDEHRKDLYEIAYEAADEIIKATGKKK
ncbi:VRR-NUC domain-containing protein [Sulfitobacter sp. 1A15106]|uniref:VRR-NUC domain-containing protein n=1 Tax=Sulfitobacter sp. 1A15106 TaxID=3368590 RepID=UPI003745C82E